MNQGNAGGYGAYSNNARNDLFKGARAPAPTTGASFDSYAAGRSGSYNGSSNSGNTGRSAPQAGYGSLSHGYDDEATAQGEGTLSGAGGEQDQEYTEEDDEV